MSRFVAIFVVCSLLCGLTVSQDFADGSHHHRKGRRPIENLQGESGESNLNFGNDPNISAGNENNGIVNCRQNYVAETEEAINLQINLELYASHVYMSMSYYFDRTDVELPGFAKFFKDASDEEREHAEKLMKYQNQRGGRVRMELVEKPARDEWGTGKDAMVEALALEKEVNRQLLKIEELATENNDPHLADFVTEHYLIEQVESIEELSRHIASLERVGPNLGEYMYDRKLQGKE